jgi:hypothetical protein
MDLVIGIIFDVIATAALVYLFIFGYNSEYEARLLSLQYSFISSGADALR